MSSVKEITIKKRSTWGMLLVALLLIFTPIILFIAIGLGDIFSIESVLFFIGIPLIGLISMYQYLLHRKGYRAVISHKNGETTVDIRRGEKNAAGALIQKFQSIKNQA